MDKNNNIDVTILMPCLDEEDTLGDCIDCANEALSILGKYNLNGEILVSDNGSVDSSIDIARSKGCRVIHSSEKGYGSALIAGCKSARGKYIVMGDSDSSYDFKESVPMILKLSEGFDLCIGNRFTGKIEKGAMPWKNNFIGNPVLTKILNIFFNSGIGDAHSGMRALTKKAFNQLRLTSSGMEFASEMIVKASLLGLHTTEVSITLYKDGRNRQPHLRPIRDGWRHLKILFMYSPYWLYFIPSSFLLVSSIAIFIILLSAEPRKMFTFGPFWIGDHWMILASGFFTIGYGGLIFGMIALAFSVQEHCRELSTTMKHIYRMATIENAIMLGSILLLASLGILIYVFEDWVSADFQRLARIREMVVATVLCVSGLTTIFGSFVISLISEGSIPEPSSSSLSGMKQINS